jgi:penicillin-binding protein 1A
VKLYLFFYYFIIVVVLTGAFAWGALFFVMHNHVIDFSILSHYNHTQPSFLLDDEGNKWAKFQLDRRDPVDDERVPQHLVNAFIAAEDWTFFAHSGISWKGIIRSMAVNAYYGRRAQGASTITQQLVKLLFFDSQKTFTRKIKEQVYAILVEQQFTKDQILHTYFNHVCFGCGIYGIEAASQRFWSKHAHELSIDESAVLAGIICSPARYCPLVYPLSAERRRNLVLTKMRKLDFISQQEYDDAIKRCVDVKDKTMDSYAVYVKEMARTLLEDIVGKSALYSGGLHIKTTINKKMQCAAQEAFLGKMEELRKEFSDDLEGGIIVIDRKTGEIKALVGGVDFVSSKFNRAIQARRQIGSTFKPLIYAVAMDSGMQWSDTDNDEPLEIIQNNTIWAPKNYNKKFNGQITLAYALSHSNNIVSIKTFLRLDAQKIISLAKQAGMKGMFHAYPSLALGCVDGTLSEVAGMFNIFANDGVYVEPHLFSWIKNRWGERIYKAKIGKEKIITGVIAGKVASVLALGLGRVKNMYGAKNWIDSQAISKTGTTNDSRTCWFVGSTPTLTTAVYVGYDDNRSMGQDVYPIRTAFPIWLAFNKAVEQTEKIFSYDSSLQRIVIDEYTGNPSQLGIKGAISVLT